jgi:hypothetical protein
MAIAHKTNAADCLDKKNELARCPMSLTTSDGRELHVRAWQPVIEVGNEVSVTVTGFMRKKKDEE